MGPMLRKELGEQFVAAGLVGAAMELFEELELWDALILCYRLLQKNVQAEELVRKRLEVGFHMGISCEDRLIVECAIRVCSGPSLQCGSMLHVSVKRLAICAGAGAPQPASPHMHILCSSDCL